jgi:hypothetical protein
MLIASYGLLQCKVLQQQPGREDWHVAGHGRRLHITADLAGWPVAAGVLGHKESSSRYYESWTVMSRIERLFMLTDLSYGSSISSICWLWPLLLRSCLLS